MTSLTTTTFDLSPLCTIIPSSSTSPSSLQFKFPANPRRPFLSTLKARASSLHDSSIPATTHEDSGNEDGSFWQRRGLLICTSAMPFLLSFGVKAAELDTNVYTLIKNEVRKVMSKGKAAGVLRLVFHDAGTFKVDGNAGGMNGSIIYELERPENAGLTKSLKVLEKAKKEVDAAQPGVSWADMIAVSGAEAVAVCGGPAIPVLMGRVDSTEPDAEGQLPAESLEASGLKQCFQRKGFSTQELVALSGAHTLGSKGFGNPNVFDNTYYKILLEKPWSSSGKMSNMIGLPTDHALVEDDECLRWIKKYADNQNVFFNDFKNAYVKLVNSGARWKS